MKYILITALLAILLPVRLLAQNYFPGYVIKNNGDTLRGYVYFRNWENNPDIVRFKPEVDASVSKLSTNDIQYFSIDIGYPLEFQRYNGPVSMDDININTISTYRDTSYQVETIFLKILRKNKNVTLFSYDDKLKTRYFVAEGQSGPVELGYRIYKKSDLSGTVDENLYKTQLNNLALKYGKLDDALKTDINNASYAEANIVHIADTINGYTEQDSIKRNSRDSKPKTKLLIILAAVGVVAYLMFSVMHR